MEQPKQKDIEAAEDYLRRRLDAERSMQANLGLVMREAAERIVDILYTANVSVEQLQFGDIPQRVQWDINAVIDWLRETIDDYFETLALYEKEDRKHILLPYIKGENHGLTFDERLTEYCSRYKDELLLLIGAGLFLGLSKTALAKTIGDHLKQPYKNPDLVDGIAAPLSYGRGRSNSMLTAIGGLTRFGIAQSWMKDKYLTDREDGCIGWVVRRGSAYPCELCDSMVGFHTEEDELPPYHGHCCCIAIPIYAK